MKPFLSLALMLLLALTLKAEGQPLKETEEAKPIDGFKGFVIRGKKKIPIDPKAAPGWLLLASDAKKFEGEIVRFEGTLSGYYYRDDKKRYFYDVSMGFSWFGKFEASKLVTFTFKEKDMSELRKAFDKAQQAEEWHIIQPAKPKAVAIELVVQGKVKVEPPQGDDPPVCFTYIYDADLIKKVVKRFDPATKTWKTVESKGTHSPQARIGQDIRDFLSSCREA